MNKNENFVVVRTIYMAVIFVSKHDKVGLYCLRINEYSQSWLGIVSI